MSKVQKVRRDEKLRIINEILEEDGCIVIEGILDDARHSALASEIGPMLDATAPCQGNFYGFATKRLSGLIAKSECCRLMRESIQYALDHSEESLAYALQFSRDLEPRLAEKFVGMYVNHFTVDGGEVVE